MESREGVLGSDVPGTDTRCNQKPLGSSDGEGSDAGRNVRVVSVDKVTVEKIVLESSGGSRQVLLTKNETSRKLSLSSETKPSVVKRTRANGGQRTSSSSANGRFRVSVPEDTFTSKADTGGLRSNDCPGGQSKLPVARCRRSDDAPGSPNEESRIKPIRLTKSPSIGSIGIIEALNWSDAAANVARKRKVPPRVPEKPADKRERNSSLIAESVSRTKVEPRQDLSANREELADEIAAQVKQGRAIERDISQAENRGNDAERSDDDVSPVVEVGKAKEAAGPQSANERCNGTDEIRAAPRRGDAEESDFVESREECARLDKDAQVRLERSQTTIEDLQKNLSTRIHASTAQSYKEKLLDLQANYALRLPIAVDAANSASGRLSCGFDKDFLEKHNLDKRLKIEERRLLETDLDYTSDNDNGNSEIEDQQTAEASAKRIYSEKVTEVERRWSGEFLENQLLQRNSSESSRSSYVEEFGSVSSRESIVEDRRDVRLLLDRKRSVKFASERQTSTDESKRRTSDEIAEDTTVSTVDSDSCLEDRIKAVDEDIARTTNGIDTDDNDDDDDDDDDDDECIRWHEEAEKTDSTLLATSAIIHEKETLTRGSDSAGSYGDRNLNEARSDCRGDLEEAEHDEGRISQVTDDDDDDDKKSSPERNDEKSAGGSFTVINSKESTDPASVEPRSHRGKDGYANLIKEFTMEASSSSKVKKEEKQKKKLGFRRLLPAIFSPKDSRKDYKKKEQKERKRYDERHFARYQQNGNYTRSPDTMNLNEDIKRNVKLDNSLNGSIIEERLDEIKRELFPEQGPITSTPDHFLQTDDSRLLRDRARAQRSYTTDSSLSSIAPDDRWLDRSGGHLGISPDVRKYEQRQRREEQESRRYGQLERKHSLQESSNHSSRNYYLQRNHGASGRISAPPSERYLVRPRAIHPVDRPLPEIPQSRVELSNYENYQDGVEQPLCDALASYRKDAGASSYVSGADNYQNQAGLYQNDRNDRNDRSDVEAAGLMHLPQSVPAQMKITRQPIVNQTQRAPLVGRSPKYPSPGSSQKSGDYADSSCTPNSSQKSEFSPSSSKSGEYYLHSSPRSSARTSPSERAPFDDAPRERIYENEEAQPVAAAAPQPTNRYVDEHVYDETPSSPPCREERPTDARVAVCARSSSSLPERRDERKCSPSQRSPCESSCQQSGSLEGKESEARAKSKREREKLRSKSPDDIDVNSRSESSSSVVAGQVAERTRVQNVSPSSRPGGVAMAATAAAAATSPSAVPRALTRKSQPNDQILIASPKREVIYQSRVPRPPNGTRLRDVESPVPIADSRECISDVVPVAAARDHYGSQDGSSSVSVTVTVTGGKSAAQRAVSSSVFAKGISRPEPIYGHRKQQQQQQQSPLRGLVVNAAMVSSAETKEGARENNDQSPRDSSYRPAESCRDLDDDRLADWVEGETLAARNAQPRNPDAKPTATNNEPAKRATLPRSPPRELYQQRQHGNVPQQRASSATSASSSSDGQRSSPMTSQDKVYVGASPPIYEQRQRQQPRHGQEQPMYVQRSPPDVHSTTYTQQSSSYLSPSRRETRQHLEAFYWQQKALEAQRKSAGISQASPGARQVAPKINLPEVREALWQQLKKLDEEQQRRIYEQNLPDDGSYETAYCRSRARSPTLPPPGASPTFHSNAVVMPAPSRPVVHGDASPAWGNMRQQQRPKLSSAGKLPLMQAPKGQNQPVLIVRPQQALRDRQEMSIKSIVQCRDPATMGRGEIAQRSKSASPHFHRGEIERSSLNLATRAKPAHTDGAAIIILRRPEGAQLREEDSNDGEGRSRPHPIFKRGSLIGGESAEYGSAGPKRVSFSNQPNIGPDLAAAGSWPTKHGTAPEPPTRRHRSEDSSTTISDTDSVFLHQDLRRDANQDDQPLYAASGAAAAARCRAADVEGPAEQDYDANRPLPPLPKDPFVASRRGNSGTRNYACNDVRWSNEEQRGRRRQEEEWNPDGKGRQSNDTGGSIRGEVEPGSNELTPGRRAGGGGGGGGGVLGVGAGGGGGSGGGGGGSGNRGSSGGGRSRDEPRRHTLGGDHQPSLHHQQFNAAQQLHPLHPHHLPPPHGQYGTPPSRHTTMDLEMGTKSRQRKSPLPRGYPPPSSTMLFDDDPGIMSEVETSSTGFRRGGKQRSSLPVVRTPSKTLERPLGLVFLQYRNETKRALLPNEITSIDTVKALFVRSFPKQLTMEYLDSPHVKVYIHDSNKDMFYELEDVRSHLRDIKDRSVLRLFESADGVTGMPGPMGVPGGGGGLPPHWEDQSYFSEPEFDSEYQHQHIHKSKTAKNSTSGSGYYVGGSSTLPRGGPLLRAYSPAASSVVGGPNATPTQPKTLTTPDGWIGGGGVPPAKPLRSYQCGKSPLGSLGGSARFSRDSSVSLYSIPDRLHGESGYMSSPERGGGVGSGSGRYPPGPYSAGSSYEDPYYSQYSGTVTPVIDEEASDTELLEESYSLYGVKPPGRPPSGPPRSPFPPGAPPPLPPGGQSYDATRIRVEHMERQLANLTGLVQKALTHAPHTSPSPREYLQVPPGRDPYTRAAGAGDEFDKHSSSSSASLPVSQPAVTDDSYLRTDVKPPKLGKDKSVSFEKSVSFSDEPPDMNSPKQHSPQHAADTKPTKPAIKSSTLPRMSSQERDRHKPTPPPKPAALVAGQYVYRDLALTPEMYNQLRGLQKKAKDLRQEVRNLRRMSQAQAHTVRETIRDTFITIRAMLLSGGDAAWTAGDAEKIRLSREEDLYKQEMIRLEKDLTELESTVEELRGNVINRKTRVNMSDVENMALILSKSSKTVADLKVRFPSLQEGMKGLLSSEMEKVVREEKFLKEEPERLESALRRCKKLTGTLVTLKRLASVQEQRLPNAASVDAEDTPPITPTTAQHSKYGWKWSTNFKEAIQTSHEQLPLCQRNALSWGQRASSGEGASLSSHPPPISSVRRTHSTLC
ncbi:uncharacterized protein LOC105187420 isoform X28 [Harpegnathos saltator]|uniref:uncharacterized protein LOC105187420 isoform X28 n=1 Tax=Harpegnathos saltator TaxID=610380 RepID=UPI000DBEE29D|nr:uncharacterized protein LOC105187420 isoform X28 [Harpegnathos saltator]